MCNLYSITAAREAQRRLFGVSANRTAAIEPLDAVFPGREAPIVRLAEDGERELVEANWGFVLLQKDRAPKRVTNVRDDKITSRFWAASLRERRCLVPVTSFSEPKGSKPAIWHWFAFGEDRPLFAFAGIWRPYNGPVRKDGEKVSQDVYAFLTTKPNKLVATVHPSRMPVLLRGKDEFEQWLEGDEADAKALIRTVPDDEMLIVQKGQEKRDNLVVAKGAFGA